METLTQNLSRPLARFRASSPRYEPGPLRILRLVRSRLKAGTSWRGKRWITALAPGAILDYAHGYEQNPYRPL